jgi:DNA-binding CsgD family transcriptional regulator
VGDSGRRPVAIEWEPVIEVIGAVAAVEDPGSFGPVAMEALAGVVRCDSVSYNEVDTATGDAVFCAHPADQPFNGADVEAFPRLVRQNPILRHQASTGDGSALRLSDFITLEELHELELYRRIYRPLGVEHQVAFALATKHPLVIAFALNRHHPDFDHRDLAVLEALRPHLIQAYRNVQAVAALRGIEGALAQVGKGIVVLGPGGYGDRAPAWAHGALAEHFGEPAPGSLPAPVGQWLASERRKAFDDGRPRIHRPLVSVIGDRQLVVRYVPGAGDRPDVLVVDEREPGREAGELRRLGLTPREAEILLLVTRGEPTVAAARALGVSTGTLSKHLQHIYRKLGVTSRTAAVAAASDAIFSAR